MKASEAIKQLQALIAEHGDRPLVHITEHYHDREVADFHAAERYRAYGDGPPNGEPVFRVQTSDAPTRAR